MDVDPDELTKALARLIEALAASPAPKAAPVRRLLRVAEAAEQLCVSTSTVYSLIRSGEIRAVKLGAARRVPQGEIDRILGDAQ